MKIPLEVPKYVISVFLHSYTYSVPDVFTGTFLAADMADECNYTSLLVIILVDMIAMKYCPNGKFIAYLYTKQHPNKVFSTFNLLSTLMFCRDNPNIHHAPSAILFIPIIMICHQVPNFWGHIGCMTKF